MPVNVPWDAAFPASRIPIPSRRFTRMEENPKSIARPRVCPPPTRYKKSTETSWDDQTSRCHDGNDAPVDDDDRNEAACRRDSSRGFSRRRIRPPKPLGSINRKTPKRSVENEEPRWRVASAKSTRGNRSTAPSCDAIKETRRRLGRYHTASWFDADDDAPATDADATTNEGGFYPFSFL